MLSGLLRGIANTPPSAHVSSDVARSLTWVKFRVQMLDGLCVCVFF